MKQTETIPACILRERNNYINRIIEQLRRLGSVDLTAEEMGAIFTFSRPDGSIFGQDGPLNSHEFFLDRVGYVNEESFYICVSSMVKSSKGKKLDSEIKRKPDTEQRFVIGKSSEMVDPFLAMYDLSQIANALERHAKGVGKAY